MFHKWLFGILAMLFVVSSPFDALAEEHPAEELQTEGGPAQGRLAEELQTEGDPAQGRLAEERPAEGTLVQGRPAGGRLSRGPGGEVYEASFDVNRFDLPEEAKVLVVVEGTFGSECKVHAFEMSDGGWAKVFETDGWLGHNGMSNNRVVGDSTTPIGVFQMNTPFGQAEALEGFPENYIQVNDTYIWSGVKNVLCLRSEVDESSPEENGELVWAQGYWPAYEYVIDMGYNRNAIAGKGAALFIHCKEENEDGTAGCVAIDREKMIQLMGLYGKYGDGHCYIALAPFGTFPLVYDTYGVNDGLSPDGLFSVRSGSGKAELVGPGYVGQNGSVDANQSGPGNDELVGPGAVDGKQSN